jgi:hypothetical protein
MRALRTPVPRTRHLRPTKDDDADMDTPTHTPTPDGHDGRPAHDDTRVAEDAASLALARAIGARLRRERDASRRDLHVATSAAAVMSIARSGADVASLDDARDRRRWSGGMRSAVAVAASVAMLAAGLGVTGVLQRGDDLPVLALGAGGDGAPMAAEARGGDAMIGDMRWIPARFVFELADGVTFPGGTADVWRVVPPADLPAAAADLAARLGLPAPGPSPWDDRTRYLELPDGGGSLWVGMSGDWFYSGPYDDVVWSCPDVMPYAGDGVGATDGDGTTLPDRAPDLECTPPPAPVGVPDEVRARALAAAYFPTVGLVGVRITDVHADEWGAYVMGILPLDGGPADQGLSVSVAFGGGERVTSASGTLGRAVRIGAYPLADGGSALARLDEQVNGWLDTWLEGAVDGVMPMPRIEPAIVDDEGAVSDEQGSDGSSGSGGGTVTTDPDRPVSDGDGATVDPDGDAGIDGDTPVTILPVPEPMPGPDGELEIETRQVRIVAISIAFSWTWTADEQMILAPHFVLTDADGGEWWIVAIADRYLVGRSAG